MTHLFFSEYLLSAGGMVKGLKESFMKAILSWPLRSENKEGREKKGQKAESWAGPREPKAWFRNRNKPDHKDKRGQERTGGT